MLWKYSLMLLPSVSKGGPLFLMFFCLFLSCEEKKNRKSAMSQTAQPTIFENTKIYLLAKKLKLHRQKDRKRKIVFFISTWNGTFWWRIRFKQCSRFHSSQSVNSCEKWSRVDFNSFWPSERILSCVLNQKREIWTCSTMRQKSLKTARFNFKRIDCFQEMAVSYDKRNGIAFLPLGGGGISWQKSWEAGVKTSTSCI